MSSLQRRFVVEDVGCGCRRSIFSTLFSGSSSSSSSLYQRISRLLSFSSSSATTSGGPATTSPFSSSPSPAKPATSVNRRKRKKRNRVAEESVAVVKESSDPYLDFYESMLVMIVEKEMYGWEDLCDLLRRYLSLNSACHHNIILRAFADIWNDVFSPAAEVAGGSTATAGAELIPRNSTDVEEMTSSSVIN